MSSVSDSESNHPENSQPSNGITEIEESEVKTQENSNMEIDMDNDLELSTIPGKTPMKTTSRVDVNFDIPDDDGEPQHDKPELEQTVEILENYDLQTEKWREATLDMRLNLLVSLMMKSN